MKIKLYLCIIQNERNINPLKNKIMTKQEFSKTVKILKSRVSATGFINISYVHILSNNAVSTERKVCIEKVGGALNSLYTYVVCG